jgi:hypothetical protein
MMQAVQTSETLVNLYQSTQHYNPEDRHIDNKLFLKMQQHPKYLAITLINCNISQGKIKIRQNSGNASYHAAQNLISPFAICKCEH